MTEEKEPLLEEEIPDTELTENCPPVEDMYAEEPAEYYEELPEGEALAEYYEELPDDEEAAEYYDEIPSEEEFYPEEAQVYYEQAPEDAEMYAAYPEEAPVYQDTGFYGETYPEEKRIPETAPFLISYDMYKDAYKLYQKRFVYPKNRIFQLILLLLAVDFGYHGAMNPDKPMYFMLLLVCVSLILILWYNPRKIRRNIMDIIREVQNDRHIFSMDEEKMTFQVIPSDPYEEGAQIQPPTPVYYTKDLRVIEKMEFFLICQGKQLFYVLPKRALYDNQPVVVRETLEEKIGRRFRSKI